MNKNIAISVNNISKEYKLYKSHSDRLKEVIHPLRKKYHQSFLALKDISFSIGKGEFFGIIGRNGSGKSTLLQLICGILHPTVGSVAVEGKIAALLELGAGFNPEFTGRENVYLNGELLGFNRNEMDGLFDEIVEFSEIDEFVDQPVKTYSSGMYVRLAFAVQACVDPDILIVDEALAVGDIFFRQKCYKRLQDLIEKGCTVILVSHAMNDIEQFCQRAILIDKGKELFLGPASEAVKRYYLVEQENRGTTASAEIEKTKSGVNNNKLCEQEDFFWPSPDAFLDISQINQVSNGWGKCTDVTVCNSEGKRCLSFQQGETASFFYSFELFQDIEVPIGGLELINEKGIIIHGKSGLELGMDVPATIIQGSKIGFRHDVTLNIAPGDYCFSIGLATINASTFRDRTNLPHPLLYSKIDRICHLSKIGVFSVIMRAKWDSSQLTHHGIADLPGQGDLYFL